MGRSLLKIERCLDTARTQMLQLSSDDQKLVSASTSLSSANTASSISTRTISTNTALTDDDDLDHQHDTHHVHDTHSSGSSSSSSSELESESELDLYYAPGERMAEPGWAGQGRDESQNLTVNEVQTYRKQPTVNNNRKQLRTTYYTAILVMSC